MISDFVFGIGMMSVFFIAVLTASFIPDWVVRNDVKTSCEEHSLETMRTEIYNKYYLCRDDAGNTFKLDRRGLRPYNLTTTCGRK